MDPTKQSPQNDTAPQPVAYDKDGNPLYAAPPQFVHVSRPAEPMTEYIPPEIAQRHDDSRQKYPHLNLSKGEYILSVVKHHPIGLLRIWSVGLLLIAALMALYVLAFVGPTASAGLQGYAGVGAGVLALMVILVGFGTLTATYVFTANRFYLTNESVIQEIQNGLFSKNEQTVSLSNIEDASYKQHGLLATMLNYGNIRLSTEGDETTYRFSYVANPKQEIAILNNAVESFKNGRAIEMPTNDQPS